MSGTMIDMKRDALRETVHAFNNTDTIATYECRHGCLTFEPRRNGIHCVRDITV
ncbi:MAG: hypothetical protein HRF42_00820 [Candidatus Brocadia sp.]